MRKRLLFVLLAAMWFSAGPAWGQGFVTGSLTTASASTTACATSACRSILLSGVTGTVSVALSGTWTGTVRFEATANGTTWDYVPGDPMATGTAVSTATANGTWLFNVAALQRFQVRQSIDGTGTIVVKITSSTAFVKKLGSGAVTLAQLPFGTANQILGTNSGGTAQEHKTLSVGTSGSNFAIDHSAGGIAFNLPDASETARGLLTTGTQTINGDKTFIDPVTFGTDDTNLYRSAANTLKTDDAFIATGLTLSGATASRCARFDGSKVLASDTADCIVGTGSANSVSKFTAANTIADSIIPEWLMLVTQELK